MKREPLDRQSVVMVSQTTFGTGTEMFLFPSDLGAWALLTIDTCTVSVYGSLALWPHSPIGLLLAVMFTLAHMSATLLGVAQGVCINECINELFRLRYISAR